MMTYFKRRNEQQQQLIVPSPKNYKRPTAGNKNAKVLILCDTQSAKAFAENSPMQYEQGRYLSTLLKKHGFEKGDVYVVGLCPPVPTEDKKSKARAWKHIEKYTEDIPAIIAACNPELVVTLGANAARVVMGRAVAITKVRGKIGTTAAGQKYYPLLSPSYVLMLPEHEITMEADIIGLGKLREVNYDPDKIILPEINYKWCKDLDKDLDSKIKFISIDTEGTGLHWWHEDHFPFLLQIGYGIGKALLIPIHFGYFKKVFPDGTRQEFDKLFKQAQEVMADPTVRKSGHHTKFDIGMLRKVGIRVNGWLHDTLQMVWNIDENMMSKSLANTVRIYVPHMSGYSDEFDEKTDKSKMYEVPIEEMILYGGGDADATFRLTLVLDKLLRKNPKQYLMYKRIHIPALAAFSRVIEPTGMLVDTDHLRNFGQEVQTFVNTEYRKLIRRIPLAVRKKHIMANKALSFTRATFVIDTVFSADGFGIKPQVFTDGTKDLKDESKKIPSTSGKEHLSYFVAHPEHGQFILDLMNFQKATKMLTTYIGKEEINSGFWKYLSKDKTIHPSYSLSKTNTGRTASNDPNGQNIPKRGNFAKPYRKSFILPEGWTYIASDLSQAELRIAAWMADEKHMLQIYRDGGDIHAATGAGVLKVPLHTFMSWRGDDRKLIHHAGEIVGSAKFLSELDTLQKRQDATIGDYFNLQRFRSKAVNFGFIYGAYPATFQRVAKTDYGVDYTKAEATATREEYFQTYPALQPWHEKQKEFVHEHGYIEALHGARRHLPSIYSSESGVVMQAERQAINAPVQRFGSDLGLMAMTRFAAQCDSRIIRPCGFVHDQVVAAVKIGHEQEMMSALKWVMQNPPLQEWFGIESPIPLVSDSECGLNMGEMEEIEGIEAIKPDWWQDNEDEIIHQKLFN